MRERERERETERLGLRPYSLKLNTVPIKENECNIELKFSNSLIQKSSEMKVKEVSIHLGFSWGKRFLKKRIYSLCLCTYLVLKYWLENKSRRLLLLQTESFRFTTLCHIKLSLLNSGTCINVHIDILYKWQKGCRFYMFSIKHLFCTGHLASFRTHPLQFGLFFFTVLITRLINETFSIDTISCRFQQCSLSFKTNLLAF